MTTSFNQRPQVPGSEGMSSYRGDQGHSGTRGSKSLPSNGLGLHRLLNLHLQYTGHDNGSSCVSHHVGNIAYKWELLGLCGYETWFGEKCGVFTSGHAFYWRSKHEGSRQEHRVTYFS